MQTDFNTNPEHKDWHLVVNSVTAVKQSDNQYQGLAKVTFHGVVHDLPITIIADSKNIIWKTETNAFAFIQDQLLRSVLVQASVNEVLTEADELKMAVGEYYATRGELPSCNDIPVCTRSASLSNGNIVVDLGATGDPEVTDKKVVFVFKTNAQYDVIWGCTSDADDAYLPESCRNPLPTPVQAPRASIAKQSSAAPVATAQPPVAVAASASTPAAPPGTMPQATSAMDAAYPASPSFDCGKAATQVERLICNDPALAAADSTMAASYKHRREISGTDESSLKQSQRAFIATRNRCATADCIMNAYKARSAELAGTNSQ